MARRSGGGMTVAEAGRMGGRLVSEKYGPEFYEKIGKKGGSSTANKYGPEFFGRIGKKGGKAVTAKYGPSHFERLGEEADKRQDLVVRSESARTAAGRRRCDRVKASACFVASQQRDERTMQRLLDAASVGAYRHHLVWRQDQLNVARACRLLLIGDRLLHDRDEILPLQHELEFVQFQPGHLQ